VARRKCASNLLMLKNYSTATADMTSAATTLALNLPHIFRSEWSSCCSMRARKKSEALHGLRLGLRQRFPTLPSSAEAGGFRCSRPNERQKLQVDTPCTGFATPCLTKEFQLVFAAAVNLLCLPSDAPGDRPSTGVIAPCGVLLIFVLISLTGTVVRRRTTYES
jgi:hypothetical protein